MILWPSYWCGCPALPPHFLGFTEILSTKVSLAYVKEQVDWKAELSQLLKNHNIFNSFFTPSRLKYLKYNRKYFKFSTSHWTCQRILHKINYQVNLKEGFMAIRREVDTRKGEKERDG